MQFNVLYPSHFDVAQFPAPVTTPSTLPPRTEEPIPGRASFLAAAALVAAVATQTFVFSPPPPPPVFSDFNTVFGVKPKPQYEFPPFVFSPPPSPWGWITEWPQPKYFRQNILYDFQTCPQLIVAAVPWGWISEWPNPPLRNTSIHADFTFKGFGDSFSPFKENFRYVGLSRGEIALTGVLTDEDIKKIKERDKRREEAWEIDDKAKVALRATIQDAVDTSLGRKKGSEPEALTEAPAAPPPRAETEDEYIARMLATLQHLQSQFDNSLLIRALREMRQQELEEEADIERLLLES